MATSTDGHSLAWWAPTNRISGSFSSSAGLSDTFTAQMSRSSYVVPMDMTATMWGFSSARRWTSSVTAS